MAELTTLRQENAELKRIEALNAKALLQVDQLAAENKRLRELAGARERASVHSVLAEVLYETRDPFTRKLVLDKGTQHQVLLGQPVIDAQGVSKRQAAMDANMRLYQYRLGVESDIKGAEESVRALAKSLAAMRESALHTCDIAKIDPDAD